jgi:hypothetical protein
MLEPAIQPWQGATRSSRALLALAAMMCIWVISSAVLLLFSKSGSLALMSAAVAGYSYALFVVPVVTLFSRRLQLRFGYVLVLLSLAWSSLLMRLLFQEWPWTALLREPADAAFFVSWFGGFTLCAVGLYLYWLRRGARIDSLARDFSSGPDTKREHPSS